jgi:hypothetical protein
MALNFPINPATNSTYTSGDVTYTFDGVKWVAETSPTPGATSPIIDYTVYTANHTAQPGEGILADTTGGSFSIALPSSPVVGNTVVIADAGGGWETNNLFILRNGSTIEGINEDFIADVDGISVTFVYDGSTWQTYAQAGVFTPAELTVNNETASTSNFYPTFTVSTSGSLENVNVSSNKLFFQPSSGTLNATEINSLSDGRFKSNVKEIDDALSKTLELSGVSFTFTETQKDSIGLIAQDVEKVIPEVVEYNEDADRYTVSYGNLVGLLVEAIREQDDRITQLEQQIQQNQVDGK